MQPLETSIQKRVGQDEVTLRGHKFDRKGGEEKQVEIFYLERELSVKRRSYYT